MHLIDLRTSARVVSVTIGVAVIATAFARFGATADATADIQGSPARLQDEVRDAERAFAATMAARDHAAFVSYVSEDAIFVGPGDKVLRGRQEVADGWKAYYEGPTAPFSWAPERVEVIASGGLALSTGPVFDPAGKRVGTFTSTWRRESDGRWRVVLDSGCPPCP